MTIYIDPLTLSVVRHKLLAAAEEIVEVMTQTSFSPILNQSRDFSAAIMDGAGHLIAQAERVPIHMGALPFAVQHMQDAFKDSLEEGDVLIANDPYWGGSHLPDITLAAPVFVDGEPRLWVANRSHQGDIGGISPGGYSPSAREIWHEGLRLPPMKFSTRKDGVRADLLRMICANSRTPSDMRGDLMAQLSSVARGVSRSLELFERYGTATIEDACSAILDAGERSMRQELSQWRPGQYEGVAHLDPQGGQKRPLPIKVKITIRSDSATVDFNECEDQLASFVNSPLANTKAAVNVAFMYLSTSNEAQNDGGSRAIEILTKPGSFVHPLEPAAVTACTTLTASAIIEAVMNGLAHAVPHRVVAGFARRFRLAIGGRDRHDNHFIWHTFSNRGGAGAHALADGWSNLGVIHNPGGSPAPSVERTEASYPFYIEHFGLRQDSGGVGKYRGGLGGIYILRYQGAGPASITPTGDGVEMPPGGLLGGKPGAPNEFSIERDGHSFNLGARDAALTLMPGDRVICRSAGGGGYGSPEERDASAIARDLEYGYVSQEAVSRFYPSSDQSKGTP